MVSDHISEHSTRAPVLVYQWQWQSLPRWRAHFRMYTQHSSRSSCCADRAPTSKSRTARWFLFTTSMIAPSSKFGLSDQGTRLTPDFMGVRVVMGPTHPPTQTDSHVSRVTKRIQQSFQVSSFLSKLGTGGARHWREIWIVPWRSPLTGYRYQKKKQWWCP